jgi:hypothetical protein
MEDDKEIGAVEHPKEVIQLNACLACGISGDILEGPQHCAPPEVPKASRALIEGHSRDDVQNITASRGHRYLAVVSPDNKKCTS